MAYVAGNPETKKALKDKVTKYREAQESRPDMAHRVAVRCFQPGMGPDLSEFTGEIALEGPHYPRPHKWYATAKLVKGCVVSVK